MFGRKKVNSERKENIFSLKWTTKKNDNIQNRLRDVKKGRNKIRVLENIY